MLRARAYNRKAKSEDRGTVQVSSDYRLIFSGLATVKLDFLFFYFISRYEYAFRSSIRPSVIYSDGENIKNIWYLRCIYAQTVATSLPLRIFRLGDEDHLHRIYAVQ